MTSYRPVHSAIYEFLCLLCHMYTMGGCDARFWVESLVGGAQVNPAGCQQGEV